MSFDRGDNLGLVGSSVAPVSEPGAKGNVLTSTGSMWESKPVITRESQKTISSVSSANFSNIPEGVKKIEVCLSSMIPSGSSSFLITLGTTSGIEDTNYLSYSNLSTSTLSPSSVAGFLVTNGIGSNTPYSGIITLINSNANTWLSSYTLYTTSRIVTGAGSKTLSGTLNQVQIEGVSGATLSGSVNILYTF